MFLPALVQLFEKTALVKTELQPHQQRVVDRIQQPDQPGLVVAHGLGSGKTLTSIAAQDALKMPASVVTPAALRANYLKERKKHLTGKRVPAHMQSMQNIAVKGTPPKDPLLIVDEAHRARETGSKTFKTLAKNEAEKRMLLTGSPFYNHPADIAPLVNLAAGDQVLPQNREDFSKKFISLNKVQPGFVNKYFRGLKPGAVEALNPQRKAELEGVMSKWVDYYPSAKENFPEVNREDVKVPMTSEQLKVYDSIMKKAPPWVSQKVRSRLPPSKQESKQLNAFLTAARQVSNTTGPYQEGVDAEDPKIQEAFGRLHKMLSENERAKAVVYSNYLKGGLDPYKQRLQEAGIPFGEFTGEMPKAKRDELVRQYNENKIRTLLLSSAGGEGLDLQGTRLMQLLEPHWNDEKLKQVEGRGIRYKSHEGLPPEERNIQVERYLATRPRSGLLEKAHLREPGGSVDEYLVSLSQQKENLINQFRAILEEQNKRQLQQQAAAPQPLQQVA